MKGIKGAINTVFQLRSDGSFSLRGRRLTEQELRELEANNIRAALSVSQGNA